MKKLQHTSHSERAENDAGHKHKACKSDGRLFDENRRAECVCVCPCACVYMCKYPCVGMCVYACAHAYMHRSMYVCVMCACMIPLQIPRYEVGEVDLFYKTRLYIYIMGCPDVTGFFQNGQAPHLIKKRGVRL